MNPAPKWFVPVAVLALVWNLVGCAAIAVDLMLTADDILKMPAEQQALYDARPGWAVAGSILAVLGGALGSTGLVLRRRWAGPLLLASLAGVLTQVVGFIAVLQIAPLPAFVIGMQTVVLAIAIALVLLARKANANGWLR